MKKIVYLTLISVLCITQYSCLNTNSVSGSIGVNPDTITVAAGTSQVFSVVLTGAFANITVKWSIQGQGCTAGICGTIDQSGNYTAPNTTPANPNIQIVATDTADPSKFGVANVTIGASVTISITQPVANPSTVSSTQTLTFAAKITNSSNTAVNWSVAGAGCSGAACGTFSPAQTTNATTTTYTAPNPLTAPPTVTVTATSVANPSQTATLTVNLTLLVTVTPGSATIGLLDTQQFSAQISGLQGSPPATITWALSNTGTNCALATNPCGTISATGFYQAPAALPSPAAVTVTASVSQAVTNGPLAGTGTASVNLISSGGAASQLFDHYAFIYRGYSISGGVVTPFVEAGSLIFDGGGNIVAGSVEDDNNGTSFHQQRAVTGTYQFDAADNTRGSITLSAGLVTSLRFVLVPNGAAVATTVFLTDFGGATAGAGRMQQQDKTQFSNAALAGGTAAWAMQMRGNNNAPSAVGRFDVQASGTTIANGELGRTFDTTIPGDFGDCSATKTINLPAFSNFFTGTISSVTSSGNAAFSLSNLSVRGVTVASATFSAYVVSASKLFLIETDSTGFAFVGSAEQQSKTNFSNADFQGGVYNQLLYSVNGPGAGNTDLTISEGPGTSSSGTITGVDMEWGGNLDGTFAEAGFDSTGYYSVQPNGLSLYTGCTGLFIARYVMYFVSPNRAFMWDIVANSASTNFTADMLGELDFQEVQEPATLPTSFGGTTNTFAVSFEGLEGNFAGDVHTASNAIAASGVVQFDYAGVGTVQFILDVSRGAANTGTTPVTITGTYTLSCTVAAPANLTDQGCEADDTFFAWGGITSATFTGTPPFTFQIPNHFWFTTSNLLLFSYDDNVGGTFTSNISGLAIKNQ